jgi:hypothetical protein
MRHQPQQRSSPVISLGLLAIIVAIAVFNGQKFSPAYDVVFFSLRPFVAGTFLAAPPTFFHLITLFIVAMTLALGGVPAALYERLRGHRRSTVVSMLIWLLTTAALSYPAAKAFLYPAD